MRPFIPLLALVLGTTACTNKAGISGPPSVYANWKGSRFALHVPYERYTLDNGLEVILNEDHSQPVVAVTVVYDVGTKDDPPGADGFAHLFEHLMFQGSRHVSEDRFFQYLERVGASHVNGATHREYTSYTETLPAGQLELALWLESDRMAFLLDHLNPATFETQRNVVANELRDGAERPYGRVGSLMGARLYPAGHPYFGRDDDAVSLVRASLEDARRFWRQYYRPNNATLFLSGDFQGIATKQQIEKYFGPIVPGVIARPPPVPRVEPMAPNSRLEIEADVNLGKVFISWHTPAFGEEGDADLDVIADMLEDRWMAGSLVYEKKVALDLHVGQASARLGSLFTIAMSIPAGGDYDAAIAAVDESLTDFAHGWRQPSMIRSSTFPLLLKLAKSLERPQTRVGLMASNEFDTGDPNFVERDVGRYERVTPASIMQTAQKLLPLDRRLVTIVRPVRGAPPGGRIARSR